jgi:hypothetical protein
MARLWRAIRPNQSMGFIGGYTDSLDIRILLRPLIADSGLSVAEFVKFL